MPPTTYGLPHIPKRKRLTPKERQGFADLVVQAYLQGASLRTVMLETGRSYGAIRGIVHACPDVEMRSRGGAHHRHGRRGKQHTDP